MGDRLTLHSAVAVEGVHHKPEPEPELLPPRVCLPRSPGFAFLDHHLLTERAPSALVHIGTSDTMEPRTNLDLDLDLEFAFLDHHLLLTERAPSALVHIGHDGASYQP